MEGCHRAASHAAISKRIVSVEYKNEYVNCCTKLTYLVIIYLFLEEKVISFVSYLPARINYFRLKSLLLKISCLKN
jgi:hypothetical protein